MDKRAQVAVDFLEANKERLTDLNTMQMWGVCDRFGILTGFGRSDPTCSLRTFRTYLFNHYRCDRNGNWDLKTRIQ